MRAQLKLHLDAAHFEQTQRLACEDPLRVKLVCWAAVDRLQHATAADLWVLGEDSRQACRLVELLH